MAVVSSCDCVSVIGYLCMVWVLFKILTAVHCAVKTFGGKSNLKSYGSWAIVTGSTDGIGLSIAKELAKQGINLILISRNSEKLNNVATMIEKTYRVSVKTEAVDMSTTTPETYADIHTFYGDLDVGILVNNVGLSYDHPEYLESFDTDRMWKLINMNIIPVTALTKEFLKNMTEKKKGLVVNVGSMSGVLGTPLLSVYSASKAYVHTLSEALRLEYLGKNIHFQEICPMYVATAMTGMRVSMMCPTPDQYAKSAVATFGKTHFTCGYWTHSLQATIYGFIPKFIFDSMQLKAMKRSRARFFRKQEQKKE